MSIEKDDSQGKKAKIPVDSCRTPRQLCSVVKKNDISQISNEIPYFGRGRKIYQDAFEKKPRSTIRT